MFKVTIAITDRTWSQPQLSLVAACHFIRAWSDRSDFIHAEIRDEQNRLLQTTCI